MKKILLKFIILSLFLAPVSAMEWGGLITEDARVSTHEMDTSDLQIKQGNSICLWLNVPITDDGKTYFTAQGSGRYSLDFEDDTKTFSTVFDLDLFKLAGSVNIFENTFSYAVGRFSVSDLTGKVFSQMCDGALFKYTLTSMEVTAYAGYTGLLNGLNVSMLGSEGFPNAVSGEMYARAHGYVPLCLSCELPYVFLNQTLTMQACGFLDMEAEKYNRYYGMVSLYGPIAGPVYYALASCAGTDDFKDIFNYSSFSLQCFISQVVTFKLNAEYASGNNGPLSSFVGFTSSPAYNSLISPELSGVIMSGADFLISTDRLYIGLNGRYIMSMPEDEIQTEGVNATANVVFNIFSDLQLGVTGIYYHDINTNGEQDNLSLNVNLSLSF